MRRIFLLAAILLIMATSVGAIERPALYGFSLPCPVDTPYFAPETEMVQFDHRRMLLLLLDIDENGAVSGMQLEDEADSAFARYVQPYVTARTFHPALFDGVAVPSRLPVLLRITPKVNRPVFIFPVDANYTVGDLDLYLQGMAFNDIKPPRLEYFPSYFSNITRGDSLGRYPYMLFKVRLDSTGRLFDFEDELIAEPKFAHQLRSALLYADFKPATVKQQPIATDAYLMISFFPYISYPSRRWLATPETELSLIDRQRVRLLPTKAGLLAKAIPKRVNAFKVPSGNQRIWFRGKMCLGLAIDTLGQVGIRHSTIVREPLYSFVREMVEGWRFYPALDFEGKIQPFYGEIMVEFDDSDFIRISYLWLDSPFVQE